jgi:uncharacterized protein (DUF2267 family)
MNTINRPRYAHRTDEQSLLRRVEAFTGVQDADAVRQLARAVLSVLLDQLSEPDRVWLASLLPSTLVAASPHVHGLHRPADGLREFIDRVAAREGVDPGFAREHTQSVCRALGEVLDDDESARLVARLHDQLAGLFALASASGVRAPVPPRRPSRPRRTLSEGRPRSRKPLSEAAPALGQSDSLACNDNPHAETKLSSTTGTTQEREDETLARGRHQR